MRYDGHLVGIDLAQARTAVEQTVDHLRAELGEEEWVGGIHPGLPESKVLDNPYTYTDYADDSTHSLWEFADSGLKSGWAMR
ncbi:hypothetical protein ABTX24_23870 [Nocardioides sp. NPDC127514]|uniref:hypothetical protein n=1 Tax=unclassified Nocardioides TaxID=2615069 RepID=UPI003323A1FF